MFTGKSDSESLKCMNTVGGCSLNPLSKINHCCPIKIQEIDEKQTPGFSAYPNPAHDKIFIETEESDFQIELINILGQLILKEKKIKEIYVSDYKSGTYIIGFTGKNHKEYRKIILYR